MKREDAQIKENSSSLEISVTLKSEVDEKEEDIIIPLNIEFLENLYTMEERNFFSNYLSEFKRNWSLSFGEEMMGTYITFCKKRQEIPFKFIETMNNHLR